MGQILHGCATTTHAVRAAIQRSKATIAELAEKHGVNPKTVMKWRGRETGGSGTNFCNCIARMRFCCENSGKAILVLSRPLE